jgi:hypothetical protein
MSPHAKELEHIACRSSTMLPAQSEHPENLNNLNHYNTMGSCLRLVVAAARSTICAAAHSSGVAAAPGLQGLGRQPVVVPCPGLSSNRCTVTAVNRLPQAARLRTSCSSPIHWCHAHKTHYYNPRIIAGCHHHLQYQRLYRFELCTAVSTPPTFHC